VLPLEVTLNAGDGFGGVCRFPDNCDFNPDGQGAIAVAGAVAEALLQGNDADVYWLFYAVVEIVRSGGSGASDAAQLRRACERKDINVPSGDVRNPEELRPYYEPFIEIAVKLLTENRSTLELLKSALLDERTVSGTKLKAILSDC
jgi:hypothetical protein